jgi:hypothetical protein
VSLAAVARVGSLSSEYIHRGISRPRGVHATTHSRYACALNARTLYYSSSCNALEDGCGWGERPHVVLCQGAGSRPGFNTMENAKMRWGGADASAETSEEVPVYYQTESVPTTPGSCLVCVCVCARARARARDCPPPPQTTTSAPEPLSGK